MDATHGQGQCSFCGAANSYDRTVCHECSTRLPWADEVEAAKTSTAPAEPDVKISMPSQWLPPEQPPATRGTGPAPLPTVVFSGGSFTRSCCCSCLLLIILLVFLPLSCVMTSGVVPIGDFPLQTEIQRPISPRDD